MTDTAAGIVRQAGELRGPMRRPVNSAANRAGSIHDDETAKGLGFRGGTVAGSIHMDQFPPVLLEAFGREWFETGSLSLQFKNATTGGEAVRAVVGDPGTAAEGDRQMVARMERDDAMLVAEGTAGVGRGHGVTALRAVDLRPTDPDELRILAGVRPGDAIAEHAGTVRGDDRQRAGLAERITEPLGWYFGDSPWGGAIANPSAIVGLLYRQARSGFGRSTGNAVGLFGAIEIRHHRGPVLLDREYRIEGEVVAVGQSPKTEYVWFDTRASDEDGVVAAMRMQLRWMKASSPQYRTD